MNFTDTLRTLVRRWYITVPGIIVAIGLGAFTFLQASPSYERSASILLLPDSPSLPDNSNPYLYISGLGQAADVLVRALGSENVLNEISARYPTAEVTVTRDATTVSPIIVVTAIAPLDEQAGVVLEEMLDRSATTLDSLQAAESIPPENRISVSTLTVDSQGTEVQGSPLQSGIIVVGVVLLTVLLAALVDGLSTRRRPGNSPTRRPEIPQAGSTTS